MRDESPPFGPREPGSTAYEWALEELAAAYNDDSIAEPALRVMAFGSVQKAARLVRAAWLEVTRIGELLEETGELVFEDDTTGGAVR